MTDFDTTDVNILAEQVTVRARQLLGPDAEVYACDAATEIITELGVFSLARIGLDACATDDIIRRHASVPEHDDEDDDEDQEPGALRPGDVISSGRGIEIVTPRGNLVLDIPEALDTAMMLVSAARGDLTAPWSGDDDSTILSRGTRHLREV